MNARPIVLVKCGEPVPAVRARLGRYSLWFQRAIPEPMGVVDMRDLQDVPPDDVAGFIFMGSPLSVCDPHSWMPRALDFARGVLEGDTPALGVCFGHQLFAVAAGGEVAYNPRGVEVGTLDVELTEAARDDPLFGGFTGRMRVNASHDDTVLRLPDDRPPTVLGASARDEHQILRWAERVWSVQFHPEMRQRETRMAIGWRTKRLLEEGQDPAVVSEATEDAPDGLAVLRRFTEIVREAE
jgi:GMP synthase (glutamine-hydrolysing)